MNTIDIAFFQAFSSKKKDWAKIFKNCRTEKTTKITDLKSLLYGMLSSRFMFNIVLYTNVVLGKIK